MGSIKHLSFLDQISQVIILSIKDVLYSLRFLSSVIQTLMDLMYSEALEPKAKALESPPLVASIGEKY